ncbi:MAG: YihY/virulence factor BrkB family protein [Salinibacter sp.]
MSTGTDRSSPSESAVSESIEYYARGLYRELSSKNVFLWAQAIAFKVLVTIVPIVILATGIVGQVLQRENAFSTVARFIRELLPPDQSGNLITFLEQLQNASVTIVGIGGIGLFLSALSLFITLRIAVSNAFEQNWHRERSLFGGYLFDARMVLQVGLLFVLTVGLSVGLPPAIEQLLDPLPGNGGVLQWAWRRLLRATGLVLPLLITMAMFFQLYYLVPLPHPRKRSAFAGAAIAAVLWEGTKQAFTYYATYVGQFDQYGPEAGDLSALGNTFGLIVAFVFWIYFSSIVLMIGAVVASLYEHRHVTAGYLPGEEPPPEALPIPDPPDGSSGASPAPPGDAPPDPTAPD